MEAVNLPVAQTPTSHVGLLSLSQLLSYQTVHQRLRISARLKGWRKGVETHVGHKYHSSILDHLKERLDFSMRHEYSLKFSYISFIL